MREESMKSMLAGIFLGFLASNAPAHAADYMVPVKNNPEVSAFFGRALSTTFLWFGLRYSNELFDGNSHQYAKEVAADDSAWYASGFAVAYMTGKFVS